MPSDVTGYTVSLRAYNEYHNGSVVEFNVYNSFTANIAVTNGNTAYANDQTTLNSALTGTMTNVILTDDITMTNAWTPRNLTSRNFYGNGHTVTISGMSAAPDMGLFGVVDGGIIRDLTVNYEPVAPANAVTVNPTAAARFGGIAGTAAGNAQLINVLVKGAVKVSGSNGASETNTVSVGGLVGTMTGTSSIYNTYGGLNLTVEHSGATSTTTTGNSLYIGGIAGSTSGGTIREVSAVGDINVGRDNAVNTMDSAHDSSSGLLVGGVVGLLENSRLEDTDYCEGSLWVRSGLGYAKIGGALGMARGSSANVTDCTFLGSGFTVNKTNTGTIFYVGGFVGDFYSGTAQNCSSTSPVVITMETTATGSVYAGGFSGRINANISYCYGKGDVSVTGLAQIKVGGFSAWTLASSTNYIRNCYATGDVNAVSQGNNYVYAGGFLSELTMILEDCYATGNVTVTKPNAGSNGVIYAGGLVGYCSSAAGTGSINRSFATGTVTVHRNGGVQTNAGGLVGGENVTAAGSRKTITNSAALGQSVTATSGSTRNIGRIFGFGYTDKKSNNRALIDMQLYQHATYLFNNPSAETITNAHDDKDGQNATDLNFRRIDIWRNAAPAAGTAPGTLNGLGFSDTNWDFNTVQTRGYPILRGVDGVGLLGGQ